MSRTKVIEDTIQQLEDILRYNIHANQFTRDDRNAIKTAIELLKELGK